MTPQSGDRERGGHEKRGFAAPAIAVRPPRTHPSAQVSPTGSELDSPDLDRGVQGPGCTAGQRRAAELLGQGPVPAGALPSLLRLEF